MAVTQVKICNNALIECGADRISSITQDTKSAILLNAVYEQVRDQVLADHPWNFAIKRATLAPTSDEPEFEYDYEYDIPSDCLKVWDLYPGDIAFVCEGNRKLLCNESEIDCIYIYRNEDESSWSHNFAEAFSLALAAKIAFALTGSLPLRESLEKRYKNYLAQARSTDGSEGVINGLSATDWTDARR